MKHAFTVLELILVIVIVGISAAAVPALVMSSTKTNEAVLLQEAITSSKTKLSQILLYPWNSALNQSNSNTSSFPILKTDPAKSRPGLNSFYNKRDITRLKDDGTTEEVNAEIVGTAAKKEGINQFDQDKGSIELKGDLNVRKNILKLDYKVEVGYIDIQNGILTSSTTNKINIKDAILVEIQTTTTLSDKKNVVMRAYSFNIGTPKIITKSFANSEFK
ncbi:type II secretion system protein [Campylobacter fetus]|uniref:type II secretion system protein n=1 Tax=Campylobacter fetus TaxID=196 RepID=UPI000818C865|nr:type II secretion system protein [Campylobacter fetus]EAH8299266.1 type II secretion system protein [Campylobacter fetus]EAI7233032.1 type II secretion system protein [Campylobacter fetus]EAJ5689827.1 type II secretion system protein [Campylobacter fetus]EAK0428775.1 type II secretion system protein [Campylobacter fetus]EAK5304838.1 type II secretion system protein [Campylobacter fetus]